MTRILYVEDEPFLGKIVKESLESRGFEIIMVVDGSKALEAYKTYEPGICILDVMLPGKDGFSIGSEIRQLDSHIPIIFLTAKDQTEDLAKGFQSGGNDYLKKPFSMEELIIRVNNLLQLTNQRVANSEELQKIGLFEFDYPSLKLSINQKIIKLSHREAELLRALLDSKHQVAERSFILNKIWGDDSFFNSRNLDVYIRKLRRHLEADPSVQIITLKGVGYRFIY